MQYLNVLLESLDDENVCGNKKEVRCAAQKRLMVWIAEEDLHDFQIYGFYRFHQ